MTKPKLLRSTAGCLLVWLYCVVGWQGQKAEVLGNITHEQQPLFPPPKSQLTESAHWHRWGKTSHVEQRPGKLLCLTPSRAARRRCWPHGIQGTLSASPSFSVKNKWVRAPFTGKGGFFLPHNETFQPRQGGKPCHRSPGLHLCCQRLQGTAEVAEHGWQESKATHSVIYRGYALLRGSQGLELFLRSLRCFLNVTGSGCSLCCCLCCPALIFCFRRL